jgi:hypothetical protein
MTTTHDQITRLAPAPEPFEPGWSRDTLAHILADRPVPARSPRPWWRRTRRRVAALLAAGVVTLTAGTAVAVGGPGQVVKDALLDFSRQPNTSGNGLGRLEDPQLVAKFRASNGVFAFWVARSSNGRVCFAAADGTWDGEGVPARSQLDYGCGGTIVDPANGKRPIDLTRMDQLGGFFKDSGGPLVYGIAPDDAVQARVRGTGVDQTLPVRSDSHGFGAALPGASHTAAVTLTFLDSSGRAVGSRRWVAPVG